MNVGGLIVLSVALSVAMLAPAAAFAQSSLEPGTWTASPTAGLAFDPDADGSITLAAAVGYRVATNLAIEGELGHVFDMAPGNANVDSSLTTVHAAVLYYFSGDRVTPYLGGGIGFGRLAQTVKPAPVSMKATEIGVNLGGGVTWPLAERVWLRGDFRYFKHIDDLPSVWRFAAALTIPLER